MLNVERRKLEEQIAEKKREEILREEREAIREQQRLEKLTERPMMSEFQTPKQHTSFDELTVASKHVRKSKQARWAGIPLKF